MFEAIAQAAGVSVAADKKVVAVPASKVVQRTERTTRADRKASLVDGLREFDVDHLGGLQEVLSGFVSLVTESLGDELVLSEQYAHTVMSQALAVRTLVDIAQVVQEQVKSVVFEHFDSALAEQGHPDPQNVNASLDVPELGMSLRREGAGYSSPMIDEQKLADLLGDAVETVYVTKVIPAQEVRVLDEDLLMNLVSNQPELLEKVREALIPGSPKKARLNLRNL